MDDLEQYRSKLLHRINTDQSKLDLDEGSEESEEIRDLKEQYNSIIDRMEKANASPLGDPLEKLPMEIWQDIIRECCFDWRDETSYSRDFDQLLMFTLVSRKWSEVILSTPILWSEIVIYSDIEDLAAKLVTWLMLSGDLPLHINLEIPIPLRSELLQILKYQSHRIRTVRVIRLTFQESTEMVQRQIDKSLASLGDLPFLEAFVYNNLYPHLEPGINLNIPESIRMLYGVNLSQSNLSIESMRNLRSIYTQQPFTTFLRSLYTLPNLKTVSFNNFTFSSFEKLPSQSILKSDSPIDKTPLPWLHLTLHQRYVGDFSPILDRIAPTLLELEVVVAWGDLERFLSTCGQLQRLQRLNINLSANTLGTNLSPLNNVPTTNVHLLDVCLGDRGTGFDDNDELRNNIHQFFEAMPSFAPDVTHLSITTRIYSTPPFLFTQRMPHLKEVELVERSGGSFQPLEILLPEVEKVCLTYTDSSWASSISCPKAIRFDLDGTDVTNLTFEKFHSIQYLEIHSGSPNWDNVSLPYLQKLFLHNDLNFFSSLAFHPLSFPRLTHIRAGRTLEWDILFIMLERRNFLTDNMIAQIKVIGLPRLPHIAILRPLSDRLRGVFSDRPSNFALSWQIRAPIFMNSGINGCSLCHSNFLSCDLPPLGPHSDIATLISQPPNYPNAPEQILFTNLARRNEWYRISKESGISRRYNCGSICPVEITGSTNTSLPISLVSL